MKKKKQKPPKDEITLKDGVKLAKEVAEKKLSAANGMVVGTIGKGGRRRVAV